MSSQKKIFSKASKILKGIFILNILLLFKIWHLCIYQKEEKIIEASQPQRRVILQKAERGIIKDRFNIPLAINRIRYNAAIYYGQILQVPRIEWVKDEKGKKIKVYKRNEHISRLSALLSQELKIPAQEIEDLIHSKASLFPHVPFILKENISEKIFYKLRFLEKDWPGLHAEISSERYYPNKTVASDLIGYMGSIKKNEYLQIANEIKTLNAYLNQQEIIDLPKGYKNTFEIVSRLKTLNEKAYQFNDFVGKCGIEKKFEEDLRGSYGKKSFMVDIRGTFVKELPLCLDPVAGRNIKLTISSELQDFAEKLLSNNEATRDGKSTFYSSKLKKRICLQQPWVKGGSIIAMDPNNGEILAMASYPNFDPNDFVLSSNANIHKTKINNLQKWLESSSYLASIWNGNKPLTRQRYHFGKKAYIEENLFITWDLFLRSIMPTDSDLYQAMQSIGTIEKAIEIQEDVETIIYFFNQKNIRYIFDILFPNDVLCEKNASLAEKESLQNIFKSIEQEISLPLARLKIHLANIPHNADKILCVDLCRIAVFSPAFSDELIHSLKGLSLENYHKQSRNALIVLSRIEKKALDFFEKNQFAKWRADHFKLFLKEKRKEEKKQKTCPKPYIDYLNEQKKTLFRSFWKENKEAILFSLLNHTNKTLDSSFFSFLSNWHNELQNQPSKDAIYQHAFNELMTFLQKISQKEMHTFFNTIRSFYELNRPLYGKYRKIHEDHPLEKHLAAQFYPQDGCGYLRSTSFQEPAPQGSIFKLLTAYEFLRQNPHFQFTMIDTVKIDSKGQLIVGTSERGKTYPRIYKKGRLPRSAYAGMGEIDLLTAIERSSNPYFSIAAGDYLKHPEDLKLAAAQFGFGEKTHIPLLGELAGHLPEDLAENKTGLYSLAIGHHTLVVTPLQTALFLSCLANHGNLFIPKIIQKISGKERNPRSFSSDQSYPLQQELSALGIPFPIFNQSLMNEKFTTIQHFPKQLKRQVPMDRKIRHQLLTGMKRVVSGTKGTARAGIIKSLYGNPLLTKEYRSLSDQLVGKTSSAEIYYNPYILPSEQSKLYKHVWFCGISFDKKQSSKLSVDPFKNPELVIVVYLRYGDSGKEAAPLAAQMIKKWREIKQRHSQEPEKIPASSSKDRT